MRVASIFATLVLPLLAVAQSSPASSQPPASSQASSPAASGASSVAASPSGNSTAPSSSVSVIVSAVQTTIVSLGANRQITTITTSFLTTITPAPPTSQPPSAASSSSSPTSTVPLSTAPANIDGGGDLPYGAPHPGQSAPDGRYGPPDGYISPALAIPINSLLAVVGGIVAGGVMVLV